VNAPHKPGHHLPFQFHTYLIFFTAFHSYLETNVQFAVQTALINEGLATINALFIFQPHIRIFSVLKGLFVASWTLIYILSNYKTNYTCWHWSRESTEGREEWYTAQICLLDYEQCSVIGVYWIWYSEVFNSAFTKSHTLPLLSYNKPRIIFWWRLWH